MVEKTKRSGGKPKGYKHDGNQRSPRGREASELRTAFLRALNDDLPSAAWVELRGLTPADVEAWADRWWIHAPCVIEDAKAILEIVSRWRRERITLWRRCRCSKRCRHHYSYSFLLNGEKHSGPTGRSNRDSALLVAQGVYRKAAQTAGVSVERFSDSHRGPEIPSRWRARLGELNRLPFDASWLDDVLDSPIGLIAELPDVLRFEQQFDEAIRELKARGEIGQRIAKGLSDSAMRGGGIVGATQRLTRHFNLLRRAVARMQSRGLLHGGIAPSLAAISRAIDAVRDPSAIVADAPQKALRESRVLAAIGADPTREGREHFQKRASNHWNARAAETELVFRQTGETTTAPSVRGSLETHISWLVRFQVKKESIRDIAEKPFSVSPNTVRTRVRRLARLLQLRLRPGPARGRPRKIRHGDGAKKSSL